MSIQLPVAHPGVNATLLWKKALEQANHTGETTICFSPGRYDFYPEGCTQRYCWFSNNDEGIKTIALDLQDITELKLIGHQTELFFHGRISPVVAVNCEKLSLQGFTIDFEDSFVSDADVVCREKNICWIKIGGKHRLEKGRLHFSEDFYDNLSGNLQCYFYDTGKNEVIWNSPVLRIPNSGLIEQNGLIGLPISGDKLLSDALVIKHEQRLCPGIVLDRCRSVELKDVTIHHAAGMGVLAQLSTHISLDTVRIVPRGRRASVSDDAVHFSECRGKLSLIDCTLAGTLDDAFNAHAIYRPLKVRIPGGKFYYLDTGHFQQQGLQGAFSGETLELIKNDTGKPYARIKLSDASPLNKALTKVVPIGELPPEWVPGDNARVLEAASAELTVRGCSFSTLVGRGVLASGLKKAVIEGNYFHTSGAAVFVSGDGNYWYEAGPVEEMVIENNKFHNCCYRQASSTRETIAVFPELQRLEDDFYYHGQIQVKNNHFRSNIRPQVSMLSVKEAVLRGNSFERDETYPFDPSPLTAYSFAEKNSPWAIFRHCGSIIQEQNTGFEII